MSTGNHRQGGWLAHPFVGPVKRFDVVVVCCLAVVMQFLEFHGAFAQAEGRFLDYALGWSRQSDQKIVAFGIDDQAYKECFCSSSPLEPHTVIHLVKEIAKTKPKAIGVDILTIDQDRDPKDPDKAHRYKYLEVTNKDFNEVPTVWVADADKRADPPNIAEWFFLGHQDRLDVKNITNVLGRAPAELGKLDADWGLAIFPQDQDLGVRKVVRQFRSVDENEEKPFFARRVANAFRGSPGSDAEEILISFARTSPPRELKMSDLFSCRGETDSGQKSSVADSDPPSSQDSSDQRLCKVNLKVKDQQGLAAAQGGVALLGGIFGDSRDFYATPVGPKSGLMLNAYAVAAEIDQNKFVTEFPPVLGFVLDLLIGCVIVWIFHSCNELGSRPANWISVFVGMLVVTLNQLAPPDWVWFHPYGVGGTVLEFLIVWILVRMLLHSYKEIGFRPALVTSILLAINLVTLNLIVVRSLRVLSFSFAGVAFGTALFHPLLEVLFENPTTAFDSQSRDGAPRATVTWITVRTVSGVRWISIKTWEAVTRRRD